MRLRIPLSLAGGLALAAAFPPFGASVLLLPAIALLVWCVHRRRVREGAVLGGLFGAAFFLTHIFWMRVIGWDAWLALSLFQALYVGLLGGGLAAVSRMRWWPAWSAVLWIAVETFRGAWPFGGFTWGRAGFAALDTPYDAWLPWLGTTGAGLLVVLSAALLVWAVLRVRVRPRAVGAVVVGAALLLLAPAPLGPPGETDGTATLAIVQGNVPGDGDDLVAHHREVTANHVDSTVALAEDVRSGAVPAPDLVVWPENSTAVDPFLDHPVRAGIEEALAAVDVPLLVGAMVDHDDPTKVLNQGVLYRPGEGAVDRYTKRHPVPFGEFIPFRDLLARLGFTNFGRLSLIPRDMVAGGRPEPLQVDGFSVGDAICFDVSYDDVFADQVRAGAETLVVQTSNAMFIHTGQIEQQFAMSRLRAIETGRAVSVAAVNGLSGVIGPDGDVLATVAPRTRTTLVQEVPLVTGTPPSVVLGPWLGRAAVAASLALLVWAAVRRPGKRRRAVHAATAPGGIAEPGEVRA